MPNLGIRARLLLLLISIGLVPLALVSLLLLARAQDALSTQAFAQLQTIRDTKKSQGSTIFRRKPLGYHRAFPQRSHRRRSGRLRLDTA